MSLYIVLDPLITNQHYKAHAVFFMAAMAFSTTLINGTTARYVLEGLGMVKMTPQQLEVLEYVLKVCCVLITGVCVAHRRGTNYCMLCRHAVVPKRAGGHGRHHGLRCSGAPHVTVQSNSSTCPEGSWDGESYRKVLACR
jgi:hypothetical protein